MDLQLEGKKAIVTGGSRGIGKAIAFQLAREGVDVAICARSEGPLKESAAEMAKATGRTIVPITCDVSNLEDIKGFVKQAAAALGGIDILINSAARVGGSFPDHVIDLDDKEVIDAFEEKAVGYLRFAREVAPYMKEKGWGRIVNITGLAGRNPGTGIAGAMRNAAVVILTKSLANALGPSGINVTAIYPGATITEGVLERTAERAAREGRTLQELLAEMDNRLPTRHVPTAGEIANVAAFFCSPLAIGITGEALAVSGGAGADVHY